jgi:hypothetical protein
LWILSCVVALASSSSALATITSVVESNLGADAPAIIVNGGFGEDALALADRNHQHNGPRFSDAFGAGTLLLTPVPFGTTVVNVPLPGYMVGGDYVRFANDARDNVGYSATITVGSSRAAWYLLIDNRVDGPNAANDGSFFNDPILGGATQWVIDDGWQRVNTGLSPVSIFGAVGDYTALDEFQNSDPSTLGVGPGILVDNFYSVYALPNKSKSITTGSLEISGLTMYTVVAVVPEPASLALLACGALGLMATRRARR